MIEGILHAHSEYSYDAKVPLEVLKAAFLKEGFRFACMTEHTDDLSPEAAQAFIHACERLSDENFTFLPGFEMPYLNTHILLLGVHHYTFDQHDLRGSLERATAQGARAVIAHPYRNGFRVDDVMHTYCIGAEVWNSQYDGKQFPRPWAISWFRKLRKHHSNFYAFGGMDLHRLSHLGGPRLRIDSDDLQEDAILSALSAGHFRTVQGAKEITASGHAIHLSSLKLWIVGTLSLLVIQLARKGSSLAHRIGLHRITRYRRLHTWIRRHL